MGVTALKPVAAPTPPTGGVSHEPVSYAALRNKSFFRLLSESTSCKWYTQITVPASSILIRIMVSAGNFLPR